MDNMNFDELLLLVDDDDELVIAAIVQHLNGVALFLDGLREYPPWQKIPLDVNGWLEMQDPQFKVHFRMCRGTFDRLVTAIYNHMNQRREIHRIRTPFELCVMMALWILMNMDTFKNAALLFHTSPGVVCFHYLYIIRALRQMGPTYICWPTAEEREIISNNLMERYGYPGVIGIIDGTHSYITAPLEDPQAYVNRHHSHSILSQAVVDDQLLVRDLHVGEAGSLHDSRVFRRSPLSTNLLENPAMIGPNQHILGDGAYILTDKVIIPYERDEALNEVQQHHNTVLSSCRASVERSFGFLKMRCPRLKYFRSITIEYAVDHIVSCFVLNNFIILEGEEPAGLVPHVQQNQPENRQQPPFINGADDVGNFPNVNVEPDHPLLLEARLNGIEKREQIAALLFQRR